MSKVGDTTENAEFAQRTPFSLLCMHAAGVLRRCRLQTGVPHVSMKPRSVARHG